MPSLYLTYDSDSGFDGAGAQVQRQAAIFGIAKRFSLGYKHSPLIGISWNPNDGMPDELSREIELRNLNSFFYLPDSLSNPNEIDNRITVKSLTFLTLVIFYLKARVRRQSITLASQNPYPIANLFPGIYRQARKIWGAQLANQSKLLNVDTPLISIHVRRSAVPQNLPDGQPNPRFVPDSWYLEILNVLTESDADGAMHLEVHSDFDPASEISVPADAPNNSQSHWEALGLSTSPGEFHSPSTDLSPFLGLKGFKSVELVTGLPPLEAMIRMAQSDVLLGSRSSMSFIAGLLKGEAGKVVFPKFWHPTPAEWINVKKLGRRGQALRDLGALGKKLQSRIGPD